MDSELCNNCGARMKEWWHRLTPGLIDLLFRSIQQVKEKRKNLILKMKICKTVSEACNFNKLRYFGLIAKNKDLSGNAIDGEFVLTINAGRFLRGKIEMPVRVKTYRNKLVGKDERTIPVRHFYNKVPEFDQRSQFDFEIHEGNVITFPELKKQNSLL